MIFQIIYSLKNTFSLTCNMLNLCFQNKLWQKTPLFCCGWFVKRITLLFLTLIIIWKCNLLTNTIFQKITYLKTCLPIYLFLVINRLCNHSHFDWKTSGKKEYVMNFRMDDFLEIYFQNMLFGWNMLRFRFPIQIRLNYQVSRKWQYVTYSNAYLSWCSVEFSQYVKHSTK